VFNSLYNLTMLAADAQKAAWLRMMDLALGMGPAARRPPRAMAEAVVAEVKVSAPPRREPPKTRHNGKHKQRRSAGRRSKAH